MKPITDEDILNDIIKRLEKGVLPWRRPWSDSTNVVIIGSMKHSATLWPSNLRAPSVPFGMFNGTMLLAHASRRGYRSNLWITQKVLDQLKADLLEDDHQPVAIQRFLDRYASPRGAQSDIRYVYNIDQVKDCERTLGLAFPDPEPPPSKKHYERSAKLLGHLVLRHGLRIVEEDRAAYSPSWDVVMMPDSDQFNVALSSDTQGQDGAAHYWATLWHEVVHWTGHSSRLERGRHDTWGDRKYAFEDLVAELGAAFLCAHLGVDGEMQHESYLDSWAKALKQDRAESLWAASAYATEAKEFVLD